MPVANTTTEPLQGEASSSIAGKATIPPDRTPWFSKLKAAATLKDPKATVSYIVARDGDNGERPTLALEPDALKRVFDDFKPGTVLQERYRLIHELGRGGMGIVFLGRDQRLDRHVALKVILASGQSSSPSATIDSRLRTSFAEEARLGASLTHPAIATVFDYGFHHDNPFTVFEYIEGETLRALIERRGRLPLDEVRMIVGPLAQALDFAHGRRIVHRDLKPENIRATEQRQFKILDLGLAREFNRQDDWRFAGTPAYAAPEQAAELPSDGRADQYALGLIIFEMLTGRRPFESDSWIDLLEKHYSEPPPKPRGSVPDLPQSVEDAILRSLEKDPNRRFSTCSELAVALGCQFLAGPAPLPEILLETEVKKMGGRWKTYLYPFSFRRPRTHLALAPEALWATHRTELSRWPFEELFDLRSVGFRKLSFRIKGVKGKDRQWFKFKNRKERRAWQEALSSRIAPVKELLVTEPETHEQASAGSSSSDPRLEPVVLLKARPSTRFQLLGMVEAKCANRRSASAGLAIRGSMMGADAVVDLHHERLPGFVKTEHRASGMAVRAVDDEGRLELKTRWFSTQIGQIAIVMLIVAILELLVDMGVQIAPAGLGRIFATINLAGGFSIFGLSAALLIARWPQLTRPAALCFLAKVPATAVSMMGSVLGSAAVGSVLVGSLPRTSGAATTVAAGFGAAALLGVSILFNVTLLLFYLYVGRRAWRIDQEYRSLASRAIQVEPPPMRKWLGRLAWVVAIYYVAALIGSAAYSVYASSNTLATMPSSYAVIKTPTGVSISGNPQEWNNHAWKLATDQDPGQRDPAQAVKLAEQAVAAEPANTSYANTLGVARYRAGDFAGAIQTLSLSENAREFVSHNAFFLAMAHARLGHHDEAAQWYTKASDWMRVHDPGNGELKRFRAEAAAVLEVAKDMSRAALEPASKPTPATPK